MATKDMRIRITSDTKQAEAGMDRMRVKTAGLRRTVGMLRNNLLLVTFATAGLTLVVKKFISMATEQEVIFNTLKNTVELTGKSWGEAKGELDSLFASLQETTIYGDTETAATFQKLVLLTGDYEKSLEGLPVALDMAASGFFDLSSSARYVGMALTGNIEMLGRYFTEFKTANNEQLKSMTASEKAAYALDILKAKLKGLAENELNTAKGRWIQYKNYWGDLQEAIGDKFLSSVVKTSGILLPIVKSWTAAMEFHKKQVDLTGEAYLELSEKGKEAARNLEIAAILEKLNIKLVKSGNVFHAISNLWTKGIRNIKETSKAMGETLSDVAYGVSVDIQSDIDKLDGFEDKLNSMDIEDSENAVFKFFENIGTSIDELTDGKISLIAEQINDAMGGIPEDLFAGWISDFKKIDDSFLKLSIAADKSLLNVEDNLDFLGYAIIRDIEGSIELKKRLEELQNIEIKPIIFFEDWADIKIPEIKTPIIDLVGDATKWLEEQEKVYEEFYDNVSNFTEQSYEERIETVKQYYIDNEDLLLRAGVDEIDITKQKVAEINAITKEQLEEQKNLQQEWLDFYNENIASEEEMMRSGIEAKLAIAQEWVESKKMTEDELIEYEKQLNIDFLDWEREKFLEQYEWEAGILETCLAGYDTFINSITDMEMTGQERREAIWESMKTTFVSMLGDMLKERIKNFVIDQALLLEARAKETAINTAAQVKVSALSTAAQAAEVTKAVITGKAIAMAMTASAVAMNISTAGGAAVAALASHTAYLTAAKAMIFAEHGFEGIVDKPTMFMVAERGAERVSVTPAGQTQTDMNEVINQLIYLRNAINEKPVPYLHIGDDEVYEHSELGRQITSEL